MRIATRRALYRARNNAPLWGLQLLGILIVAGFVSLAFIKVGGEMLLHMAEVCGK